MKFFHLKGYKWLLSQNQQLRNNFFGYKRYEALSIEKYENRDSINLIQNIIKNLDNPTFSFQCISLIRY